MNHVLLFFIDGFGLGSPDPAVNPLADAAMPCVRRLLNGPLVSGARAGSNADVLALDAALGIPGLPQSATGQTTLFTGMNAAQAVGSHLTAFPTGRLKTILADHSVLKYIREHGGSAASANYYTPDYFDLVAARKRRHSASTLAILAAGLPLRQDLNDLTQGRAVYQDLTNEQLRTMGYNMPVITPRQAGLNLGGIVQANDIVLFEYFQTDRAGHSRERAWAHRVLADIDQCLSGLVDSLHWRDTLVIVTSDHGNIEDLTVKTHTRNPVPALLIGAGRKKFSGIRSIVGIAAVLKMLWSEEAGGFIL